MIENIMSLMVDLSKVENVKTFCDITSQMTYDIDLARGNYVVDAKSIIGIMGFDLSKPIEVILHCNSEEDYKKFLMLLDENKIVDEGV